jgi:hypothetical protein
MKPRPRPREAGVSSDIHSRAADYQRQWAPPAKATARSELSARAIRLTCLMEHLLPRRGRRLDGSHSGAGPTPHSSATIPH